jgi:hypothetical protein
MNNNNPLNFWQSFFGYNVDNNRRFINQFLPYQNRIWGQKTAVWIDTNNAFQHYLEIPELRTVVNKRASMMSNNKPVLIDVKSGEEITEHWLIDLMKKPNPTQSWADVVYSLSVNDALYSNSFAYAPKRSFGVRNLMLPLPSDKMKILTTGKTLRQMDKDGLIAGFEFDYNTDVEKLTWDDVVYFSTPDGINIINPSSRIEALKYPLSNLKASYHKRNVLLENIGAIGILSAKNSDIGGAIPMTPEEKKEIQRDWFARQKDELIITESDVNWQPMSYPTKDLMLFEELTEDKMALIDAYGLNYSIFSQSKGATFSNVRDGMRMSYNDTIIPETQQLYDSITEQFALDQEGLRLIADFSEIPILQKDENLKADALNKKADAIKKLFDAGFTQNQISEFLDV